MRMRTYIFAAIAVDCAVLIGYTALSRVLWKRGLPEGLIQANGRAEGDHVTIASKFPGRIAELRAREGDTVARDQRWSTAIAVR